jgi:hypothetical protein
MSTESLVFPHEATSHSSDVVGVKRIKAMGEALG